MKFRAGQQTELPLIQPTLAVGTISCRILRLAQVRQMTGLGRSCIYQLQAQNQFPQRIKICARAVGWIESEVQQWVANRIFQSRGKNGNSQS